MCAFLLFSFVFMTVVSACRDIPTIETNGACRVLFSNVAAGSNETAFYESISSYREACGFSPDDISALSGFLAHGYSVKEQTDVEYASFLAQARATNAEVPSYCQAYSAVYHVGRWTGFVTSGCYFDATVEKCVCSVCGEGVPDITWNDLVHSYTTSEPSENVSGPVLETQYEYSSLWLEIGVVVVLIGSILAVLFLTHARKK